MHITINAVQAGAAVPANDTAPGVQPGAAEETQETRHDCRAPWLEGQGLQAIKGESYAAVYLQRLQNDSTQPRKLESMLGFLSGAMLSGACRVIEKILSKVSHD